MSDEPFYAPGRTPPAPRVPQPGEPLWTVVKGMHTCRMELREHPDRRCDLLLFADREFRWSHLHASREWARLDASLKLEALRVKGWTLLTAGATSDLGKP